MQTFLYLLGDSQSDSLTVNHMYAKLILVHLLLWRAVLVICPLPLPPRGYHRSINPWTAGVEAGLLHSLTEHPPLHPPTQLLFPPPCPFICDHIPPLSELCEKTRVPASSVLPQLNKGLAHLRPLQRGGDALWKRGLVSSLTLILET